MSKSLSMTIPDRIHAALAHAGKEWEQEPAEFLRQFVMHAAMSPDGATLKLTLPSIAESPDQMRLPLGGGSKRS